MGWAQRSRRRLPPGSRCYLCSQTIHQTEKWNRDHVPPKRIFASAVGKQFSPKSAAMAMVGHKTESIYRRYAIVDAGVLRDAAAKIDQAAGILSGILAPKPASEGT